MSATYLSNIDTACAKVISNINYLCSVVPSRIVNSFASTNDAKILPIHEDEMAELFNLNIKMVRWQDLDDDYAFN